MGLAKVCIEVEFSEDSESSRSVFNASTPMRDVNVPALEKQVRKIFDQLGDTVEEDQD